jgi:Skp family chaperone for outer membrane proteins
MLMATVLPNIAWTQASFDLPPPILVIDRERLFAETDYGKAILQDFDTQAQALVAENRQIEAQLIAEEQALTDERATLEIDAFREKADAFDEKVQGIRAEQDRKSRDLQAARDAAQQAFSREIIPVLSSIMRERGALVMFDRRDVFISAGGLDATDLAIERINTEVGVGPDQDAPDAPEN